MARVAEGRLLVATTVLVGLTVTTACGGGATTVPDDEARAAMAEAVDAHLDSVDRGGFVRAVLVDVGGEVVLERYDGTDADAHWSMASVTKSVTGTLVGIAIDRGEVSGVDATLAELLPERAQDMADGLADVTLEQVLTHTAGFPEDRGTTSVAWFVEEDWVGAALRAWQPAPERSPFA